MSYDFRISKLLANFTVEKIKNNISKVKEDESICIPH
jgi:hypothetical protein